MSYSRMTERLGLPAVAGTTIATATATVAVTPATSLNSPAVSVRSVAGAGAPGRRYLVRAAMFPDTTAHTGVATVAVQHGTSTASWTAASKGSTPMQATFNAGTGGGAQEIELQGSDIQAASLSAYIRAQLVPGGAFSGVATVTIETDTARYLPNTAADSTLRGTPVVVADL